MNISMRQVSINTVAVEKLAGKIKAQTNNTGMIMGIKVALSSLILFCFFDSNLATYIIRAILAKSDVWVEDLFEVPGASIRPK